MYNLTEYSDNYSNTSRILQRFKRDESLVTDAGNPENDFTDNLASFKYKSSILGKPAAVHNNRVLKKAKIAVALK